MTTDIANFTGRPLARVPDRAGRRGVRRRNRGDAEVHLAGDPAARWTGAHGGPAFFAYCANYLIEIDHAIIVDVAASTAVRQAEKHAVEQAPDSALAWRARFAAQYARGELDQAFAAGEQVLALSPNNPEIKAIVGLRLTHAGRWERGLALVEQAIAANALHPGWYYFPLVLDHYRRDRYAEALNEAERIDMPEFFWTHAILAMIHGQLGRQEEGARAGMEVPDRDMAKKMLDGLRKAGLDVAPARDR